jgi:hypothetical protein
VQKNQITAVQGQQRRQIFSSKLKIFGTLLRNGFLCETANAAPTQAMGSAGTMARVEFS